MYLFYFTPTVSRAFFNKIRTKEHIFIYKMVNPLFLNKIFLYVIAWLATGCEPVKKGNSVFK